MLVVVELGLGSNSCWRTCFVVAPFAVVVAAVVVGGLVGGLVGVFQLACWQTYLEVLGLELEVEDCSFACCRTCRVEVVVVALELVVIAATAVAT